MMSSLDRGRLGRAEISLIYIALPLLVQYGVLGCAKRTDYTRTETASALQNKAPLSCAAHLGPAGRRREALADDACTAATPVLVVANSCGILVRSSPLRSAFFKRLTSFIVLCCHACGSNTFLKSQPNRGVRTASRPPGTSIASIPRNPTACDEMLNYIK